jgi:FMN-dependent NADH-azoreductase
MSTLLQIHCSLFLSEGQSTQLSNHFVDTWKLKHPDTQVVIRDLARHPIPHLDGERFAAFLSKPETRTATEQSIVDLSNQLIEEIRAADCIVLGLPLYNFGIPSVLKSYFDHIARAGVTFKYTEQGPVGLLPNKKFMYWLPVEDTI